MVVPGDMIPFLSPGSFAAGLLAGALVRQIPVLRVGTSATGIDRGV